MTPKTELQITEQDRIQAENEYESRFDGLEIITVAEMLICRERQLANLENDFSDAIRQLHKAGL